MAGRAGEVPRDALPAAEGEVTGGGCRTLECGPHLRSSHPGVTAGPGIGKKIARVRTGRAVDELIEHVAEVRPTGGGGAGWHWRTC